MKAQRLSKFYKKHERIINAAVFALLPLLSCILYCALDQKTIGQVYLPASEWNDELFYFKQVQGMIDFGFPRGYFGFNESHSRLLSYAAWSPVLVWPWILWGLIFGWNLMSPIYCNIALLSLAVFLFVWLTRPKMKQLGILFILFICFTPFNRYMMSSMSEIICFSMVIIMFALGVNYLQKEHAGKLVALFILSVVMTLMRPYLLVFMILPIYLWIRKRKMWGLLGSLGIISITGAAYLAVKHYLSAAYVAPLFKTDFITAFKDNGFFGGIRFVLYQLVAVGKQFLAMALEGFKSGLPEGAYFAGFLVILLLLLIQVFYNYKKKQKNELIMNGYLSLCFIAMLGALFLMYKLFEGSRHLVTFIAVGIFAVSLMETRFYKKMIVLAAVFVYLYSFLGSRHPLADLYYQVPYRSEALAEEVEFWQEIYEEKLEFDHENVPGYENTIIWQCSDIVEGTTNGVMIPWQLLYGLPSGYGINHCKTEYLVENFDDLQCRYLVTIHDGQVDRLCRESGAKLLGESTNMVLYRLH